MLAERGIIQALHKEGISLRGIAKNVGYAYTTVYYECPLQVSHVLFSII